MNQEELGFIVLLVWAIAANHIAYTQGFYQLQSQSPIKSNGPVLCFTDVLGAFAFFFVTQALLAFSAALLADSLSPVEGGQEKSFEHGWFNVLSIFSTGVGMILYGFVINPKTRAIFTLGTGDKMKNNFSLGLLTWFLCFPLVLLFSQLVHTLLSLADLSSLVDQVAVRYLKEIYSQKPLFWSSFWLIILVVPFVEEALFRGFLQKWLRQKGSARFAILISSGIFAAFHFSVSQEWANVELLAALFLLSCYLGLLYEKQGSIWAPMGLHMTFNAVSEFSILSQVGS